MRFYNILLFWTRQSQGHIARILNTSSHIGWLVAYFYKPTFQWKRERISLCGEQHAGSDSAKVAFRAPFSFILNFLALVCLTCVSRFRHVQGTVFMRLQHISIILQSFKSIFVMFSVFLSMLSYTLSPSVAVHCKRTS